MFEFVTGAIEPTAALVTAVLYELARDQKIQNLLREKLDAELSDIHQQITIDQLDRLPYLENVLRGNVHSYTAVYIDLESSIEHLNTMKTIQQFILSTSIR